MEAEESDPENKSRRYDSFLITGWGQGRNES